MQLNPHQPTYPSSNLEPGLPLLIGTSTGGRSHIEAYRAHAGAGARGMLGTAFGVTPEHAEFGALKEEFFDRYEQRMTRLTRPFEGVDQLLLTLTRQRIAWGVVTNKSRRFTVPLTATMSLFSAAGTIVCGDTTPHIKPHPAPVQEAMRQMNVSPAHCVYVGDDERDMQAGRGHRGGTLRLPWRRRRCFTLVGGRHHRFAHPALEFVRYSLK